MEFLILGPFEVLQDGAVLPLRGAKQRALLAILLLHANEIVASERLAEELWAHPPETARTALQVYVSQLRKALEPGRAPGDPHRLLVTRPPGYLLQLDPDRLDSHRFERLVERARGVRQGGAGAAAPLLREALSLWRGPALADFVYEPFAQAEIARLEELRLAALEERLDADLALGRHGEAIGELEELVRAHPLRERVRGQLMLALYRAGRQAEALEAYRSAHRVLDEELGISPGPALRRLEQQILRQEPVLEGPREPVPEPGPPLRGEGREARATVTILVGGRDEPPGLDPEAVRGLDERLREVGMAAIERHGGRVESAPGGRVVGTFGVPRAHEDDALRAARAAVELLERTQADIGHGNATATRVGIATGEVVTAGSALSGEPMSLAARLEAAAGAGEILVDASTRGILGSSVHAEPCPGTDIEATRLLALIPEPPPLARLPRSALVGREGELAQLRQAFDRVGREGTVHLFTVLGGAGIGKSRLAEEFASHVAEEATVLAGRCLSYGERITFSALREVVGGLTAAGPLSELLAGEEDAAFVAARVTEAIERAESNSALEEIFWAFRRLFESLAGERPLVLLLEDVHWAEPTLLDFVDYLSERVRAAPMLLLCLARPELLEDRPAWGGGKRNVSSLFLERLSDAESKRLVDALASGLPDATRARLLATAEGNPLFLEQLLAMVAERPASHGEIPIPPTVQAALAARLDRLGPGERAVLEAAAVVGKDFREEAVAALLPGEAEQFTRRHLDALVAKELLRPVRSRSRGQAELRFAHGLIQQTTYRAIPKRARAGLHEGVAAWLEEALGSGAAEYAEQAGYHLEQAHLHRAELDGVTDRDRELARRAADLLASAGRRAFHRGDMPAAVDLLGRATSLLPADDREGLALLPELGYALFDVGELERADALLTHAIERGRGHGFRGVELNATVMRAHAGLFTDPGSMDPGRLSRDASAAVEGLDELGDDLGLARACTLLFEAEWLNGRMIAATAAAERGAWHARRAGSRPGEAWAVAGQVQALLNGPMPAEEGSRRIDQLRRRAADNLVVDAYLLGFGAAFEAMTGSFDDARTHVAESCERLRDLGQKWRAGVHELLAGYIELLGGDPVAAERRMRAAKKTFTLIGDRWFLSTVLVDLPRPLYEQARYAEARTAVEEIDEVPAPADREWQIKRWGVRARLLAREGQLEEAERCARRGVTAASGTDMLWLRGDALMDLAEALTLAGRQTEAAKTAAEALGFYERKGIVTSAARARTLIEQFGAAGVTRLHPHP